MRISKATFAYPFASLLTIVTLIIIYWEGAYFGHYKLSYKPILLFSAIVLTVMLIIGFVDDKMLEMEIGLAFTSVMCWKRPEKDMELNTARSDAWDGYKFIEVPMLFINIFFFLLDLYFTISTIG